MAKYNYLDKDSFTVSGIGVDNCQDSCRKSCSEFFSGLSHTSLGIDQSLMALDHRRGFFARASS